MALLVALILAVAAPSLAFSGLLLLQSDRVQRNQLTARATQSVDRIRDTLDRELRAMVSNLTVLAVSGWVEKEEYDVLHSRATQALAGANTFLLAIDKDGAQILNTRVPFGTPLAATADPESTQRAITTRQPAVSNVFYGQVAKQPVFNVTLPVLSGEQRVRALILSRDIAKLDAIFNDSRPPPGWNYEVLDAKGVLVSGAGPHAGTEDLTARLCIRPQDGTESLKVGGVEFVASSLALKPWGWRACVWSSSDQVEAQISDRWRIFVAIVLAVVLASIIGGALLGRLLTGGIRRAAAVGRALDAGGAVVEQHSVVREVDDVLGTLTRAAKTRLANEENLRLLQRETAHRAKNQIAIASALVRLSARGVTSVKQFSEDVSARLTALGRSVDMMAARPGAPVQLKDLAQTQLTPFASGSVERLQLVGKDISVPPALAQSLGLVFHECATNASKYGAWSMPEGVVRIEWRQDESGLEIVWSEHGGPQPLDQRGSGFGTSLMEMLVERSLGGTVTRDWKPAGLAATFRLPKGAGES